MPKKIDGAQTSNDYTDACTIADVWNSNGGFFNVTGADVYAELQYGGLGQTEWTPEVHVPVGVGQLYPGTIGIRFRSYLPSTPATVSAAIYYDAEPSFAIGSGGVAAPTAGTGFVLISQVTLAAPGNVTFTGIPQTYTHLEVDALMLGTGAEVVAALQFNLDTGLNYSWSINEALNGAANDSFGTSVNEGVVAVIGSVGTTAMRLSIPGYRQGDNKAYVAMSALVGTNVRSGVYGGAWLGGTAAVTILELLAAGGFAAGSVFSLYGLQ